eukprot:ANDGO_03790.mRNA.1 Cell division control protein 48
MTVLSDVLANPANPPHADLMFSDLQKFVLQLDPATPFANDYEFVQSEATRLSFLAHIMRTSEAGRMQLSNPTEFTSEVKPEAVIYWQQVLQFMSRAKDAVIQLQKQKLEAQAAAGLRMPRVLRACELLKLEGVEAELLRAFVITAVAQFQQELGNGYDAVSVCMMINVSSTVLIEFAQESRSYMKAGLFPEVMYTNISRSSFNIEERMLKVLIGSKLEADDVIRLGNTFIATLLEEEGVDTNAVAAETDEDYDMLEEEDPAKSQSVEEGESAEASQEPVDLYEMLRREREKEAAMILELKEQESVSGESPSSDAAAGGVSSADESQPYKTDLEYMDDYFEWTRQTIRLLEMARRLAQCTTYRDMEAESLKREAEGKTKVIKTKIENRLKLTKERGRWMPRLERLATSKKLSDFEKNVLVVLIYAVMNPSYNSYFNSYSVRELLAMFAGESLQEQVRLSSCFLKSAPLVADGIIRVDSNNNYILHSQVNIDRRMLDFLAGLDTDFSEVVEGSRLFIPTTDLAQVVLPISQKDLIIKTIRNFNTFQRFKKTKVRVGSSTPGSTVSANGMNAGLVLLFHGPPGTGKTMCCHALAKNFEKSVLLIDYPSLESMSSSYENKFRSIFREAQLNDAIVFFDECENIFESRDHGNTTVNQLLIEIEKHPGIVILATNRRFELDEAMHRRITLAVEFLPPDRILREAIWRTHIPAEVSLDPAVNLEELAAKYELTGGFIRNAVLIAVTEAVARNSDAPVLTAKDLEEGASFQLRGAINMKLNGAVDSLVPSNGLDRVFVEDGTARVLREIVDFHKAQSVLYSQWGFDARSEVASGGGAHAIRALFAGPSGTGKSVSAEGIAFELGIPMKLIHAREIMHHDVSSSTISQIFASAQACDALVLIESLEETIANPAAFGLMMHHIRSYRGIVVVCVESAKALEDRIVREFQFIVKFTIPDARTRALLFRSFVPSKLPLDADMDFAQAANLFALTGLQIKRAIMRASARAALRKAIPDRVVRMSDLIRACQEEMENSNMGR